MGSVPMSLRPVFRDRFDFNVGSTLKEQTLVALDESAAIVVLCSPSSAKSIAVNEEVRLFKWRHRDRPVIPILLDGIPGDAANECFPPALRSVIADDGTVTNEPVNVLGADVREAGDGRDLALAKVVARLLGLAPDEVFRRAERERRRQARIRNSVRGIIAALLFAGGFLYWQSSQKQKTIAEIEALVNKYTLTSPAQGSVPGAKESLTDAIKAIAEGAATDPRYAKALELLKDGKPVEAEPLLRSVAEDEAARGRKINKQAAEKFRNLGAIAGLADPKRAREVYSRALELDPNNSDSLYWSGFLNFLAGNLSAAERSLNQLMAVSIKTNSGRDLYRAHLRLGEVDMARGDLSESMKHEKKGLVIAESAANADPANTARQLDYSLSLEKIGDVLQAQGQFSKALERYEAALAVINHLAKAEPNNAEWQRDRSVTHNKIGDVLRVQGNLTAALKNYTASFAIRDYLAKIDPANAAWQRDLSLAYENIGAVLQSQGDLSGALQKYNTSRGIRERLATVDPDNAEWQRDISVSREKIGDVLKSRGDLTAALESYKASLVVRDHLIKVDPNNAEWQRDLSVSRNKIGDVLLALGDLTAALSSFEASLAIRDRLAKADPKNAGWQADLALSHARLGQLHAKLNNKLEARRQFNIGREILAPLVGHSGNQLWLGYMQNFDADIAALKQ